MEPVAQPSEMMIGVTGAFWKLDGNEAIRIGVELGSVLIGIPFGSQIDFDRDWRARIGYPRLELFDEQLGVWVRLGWKRSYCRNP